MLHEIQAGLNDFAAQLTPVCIEHERIDADVAAAQSSTIGRYVAAAFAAVENYLDKDVFPTTHTYSDGVSYPLIFTRGLIRTVKVQYPDPDNPPGMIDYPAAPRLHGRRDFKSAGTDIGVDTLNGVYAPPSTSVLVIESGFLNFADLPPDVVEFMLAVFGTHWAVRENSNYSSMVFNVDAYPKYLLDPFRILSYA